ncbi:MAG: protein phosphatase CheZ [bacterium]
MARMGPLHDIADSVEAMANGDFSHSVSLDLKGELGRLAFHLDKIRKNLQILEPGMKESTEKVPFVQDGIQSITRTSEEGTHQVMSLTEDMLADCDLVDEDLGSFRDQPPGSLPPPLRRIQEINERNRSRLIELITSLSFQDLTGQQLKKLSGVIVEIESRILQLLVAFGIAVQESGSMESGRAGNIREKMEAQIDSLKKGDLSQDLIDDILDQL